MEINDQTLPEIANHYREIVHGALEKTLHLHSEGVVFEFETLIEMTKTPRIGIELVRLMNDPKEASWIETLKNDIASIPNEESAFVEKIMQTIDPGKVIPAEYGL